MEKWVTLMWATVIGPKQSVCPLLFTHKNFASDSLSNLVLANLDLNQIF